MAEGSEKRRVAIIGGGPGGLATAFWLTSTQALRDQFAVTVWTRGWQLGGKGATGRNAALHQRIEEHGLHLWLGFYANSFHTMREVFAALPPGSTGTFKSVAEAFSPIRAAAFMERDGPGDPPSFLPWIIPFPPREGQPGDPTVEPFVMRAILAWLHDYLRDEVAPHLATELLSPLLPHFALLAELPAEDTSGLAVSTLLFAVQGVLDVAWRAISSLSLEITRELRRALMLANLAVSYARGYLADVSPAEDANAACDTLDEFEFRDWLAGHGAWTQTLACAPLQSIYDLAFAYPGGDASDPLNGAMAAGSCVRLLVHMLLLYHDAPLWKMTAGMAETVFTPIYDVLQDRGVAINFFHALEDVAPTADGSSIAALRLRQQAVVLKPPYDPFVPVDGLRCWPSEPDWGQLQDGATLQAQGVQFNATDDTTMAAEVTLTVGVHFDDVVLAVPPDILKLVTPKLCGVHEGWRAMLDRQNCIATQAFQLWLNVPPAALGFAVNPSPPLTTYQEPYATWADMSHLLAREAWPQGTAPLAISYHCGPMVIPPAPVAPGGSDGLAKAQGQAWLAASAAGLWPRVTQLGGIDGLIVSAYYRANTDPSERYALILPGSIKFRMTPGARPFSNLYLAGDWTRTFVCGGCFENAVQSGMMAAQAISGVTMPIGANV